MCVWLSAVIYQLSARNICSFLPQISQIPADERRSPIRAYPPDLRPVPSSGPADRSGPEDRHLRHLWQTLTSLGWVFSRAGGVPSFGKKVAPSFRCGYVIGRRFWGGTLGAWVKSHGVLGFREGECDWKMAIGVELGAWSSERGARSMEFGAGEKARSTSGIPHSAYRLPHFSGSRR